jgi:hypothetical protein
MAQAFFNHKGYKEHKEEGEEESADQALDADLEDDNLEVDQEAGA